MLMKFINIIILFLSFSLATEITQDQLNKVKEITKDINKASDFSLNSVTSDSIYTLSKMNDKVILINFWATWCGPCRMEIPDFNELHEKYSSKGFEVLGVSISDTKDQLIKFLKAYKVDYPILYGDQTVMQKIISDYGEVYSIPMSFLLGKNNQIKRVYPGAILKQYDPNMYSDLIFNIESALSENNKENKSSDILDE
jgi:thiol-disulfide isomerase/thioredoxin